MDSPTKAQMKVLEKIYGGEIEAALRGDNMPVQLRSKHLPDLERMGLIKRSTVRLGGRFPVTVEGWNLTLAGNFCYCTSCPTHTPLGG